MIGVCCLLIVACCSVVVGCSPLIADWRLSFAVCCCLVFDV